MKCYPFSLFLSLTRTASPVVTIKLSLQAVCSTGYLFLASVLCTSTLRKSRFLFSIYFFCRCHNYFLCKVTGARFLQGTRPLFLDFFIKIFSPRIEIFYSPSLTRGKKAVPSLHFNLSALSVLNAYKIYCLTSNKKFQL